MYERDTSQGKPEISERTLNRVLGWQDSRNLQKGMAVSADDSPSLRQFLTQVGSPPGQAYIQASGPSSHLNAQGPQSAPISRPYGTGKSPARDIFHRAGIRMDSMLGPRVPSNQSTFFVQPKKDTDVPPATGLATPTGLAPATDQARTARRNSVVHIKQRVAAGAASSQTTAKDLHRPSSNATKPAKGQVDKNQQPPHAKSKKHVWVEKNPSNLPQGATDALREAMKREGVPDDQFNDLAWIMAQESEGVSDVRNTKKGSTARGLFQLLQDNYHYNPNGIKSFGNPVEEAQGGIRYMKQRFKNAARARQFWTKHQWW